MRQFILQQSNQKKGQGLNEYGLLMAIILVTSISSLSLLGNHVKELFFGFPNLSAQKPTAPTTIVPVALTPNTAVTAASPSISSPQPDVSLSTVTPMPANTSSASSASPSSVKVSFDSATGKIVFSGVDSGSGASTTTSGMGDTHLTQMLAQVLKQMAATGVAPDGTPIPDSLITQINSTADRGFILANHESGMNAGSISTTTLTNSYSTFTTTYSSLMTSLAKYPDLGSVTALVNDYGGVISNIAYYNYMDGAPSNTKMVGNIPGTPIDTSGITLDMSPILTQINAQNIDNTSTQVPTYYTASTTTNGNKKKP
jgi:hypothetical protein